MVKMWFLAHRPAHCRFHGEERDGSPLGQTWGIPHFGDQGEPRRYRPRIHGRFLRARVLAAESCRATPVCSQVEFSTQER
jgi:hypothetical protein